MVISSGPDFIARTMQVTVEFEDDVAMAGRGATVAVACVHAHTVALVRRRGRETRKPPSFDVNGVPPEATVSGLSMAPRL